MEEGTELLGRLRTAWGLEPPAAADDDSSSSSASSAGRQGHQDEAAGRGHHQGPGPLPMFTSCCPGWITTVGTGTLEGVTGSQRATPRS